MTIQKLGVEAFDDDTKLFKIPVRVVTPSATTHTIDMNASVAYSIVSVDYQTNVGTLDVKFQIDAGSPVDVVFSGGDATLNVGTTALNETLSSAGAVAVGNVVTMIVSNLASTPTMLAVDLLCRRT